jgi:2-polyprenyl-6-methoxyphenol hydroxylase-like FAD-dependent oxidoreductase
MLGFLLARAGVDVVVLEKHADFLRDFRGDTVHPSTLEIMGELGLLEQFLKLPHQEVRTIGAVFSDREYAAGDFTGLRTRCKFLALMPQWDFLNFLSEQGRSFPSFQLHMQTEGVDVIEEGGRIVGVGATAADGPLDVRADLTVACDGRHSTMRARAGLVCRDLGAPMDVLWFRLPRRADDVMETMGRFTAGGIVVLLNRGDYWQCAFVIPKGGMEETRRAGLAALRASIAQRAPMLADRVEELKQWDDIKLLTVAVNRLERWHRLGLLCIGDAAHAMSPIGGVGINLAVQDAVAAANILWQPLVQRTLTEEDLDRVQKRRMFPTRMTQSLQLIVQNNVIGHVLGGRRQLQAPLLLRLASHFAPLRRMTARLVGVGVRPEHVHSPQRQSA